MRPQRVYLPRLRRSEISLCRRRDFRGDVPGRLHHGWIIITGRGTSSPARALALLTTKEPRPWLGYERQMPRVGNPEPVR